MPDASFPGAGQDGGAEPPLPGGPARDDDFDQDAEMASYLADIEAGRAEEPGPWDSPACMVSLGEACDVDPAVLGAGGAAFAEGRAGDAMVPGPVLAALTGQAAEEMAGLSDDALLGAVSAAWRLAAWAEFLELKAVAEFGRRRAAQCEAAKAAGVRPGRREGEFPGDELAFRQVCSDSAAYEKLAFATDLATRLPGTFAGLGAGRLDRYRALIIHRATLSLSGAHAAVADEILAPAAPGLTYKQLRAKAAAVEKRLDPEAAQRRKDQARARHRRVEARREDSGNMAYGGRELSPGEALAAKAAIDAGAAALRNAGAEGSLRELRVRAYLARLQGKDPLGGLPGLADRASGRGGPDDPAAAGGPGHPGRDDADEGRPREGYADEDDDADEDADEGRPGGFGGGPQGPGTPAGGLAPLPALITVTVPAGTLLGWSLTPGDAGTWGLTDPDDTRRLVQAASQHPRSRWCVTITGPDGTAVAHGCARGQHPWTPGPGPGQRDGPGRDRDGPPGPDARQAAQLLDLLRQLNLTLRPVARGSCDHRHREDRYVPSRALKHLVRARTATCTAPGCGARAIHCDLDHTIAYPAGITCECGLAPKCRHHHRVKQAPGWRLDQPEPGVMRWTTPAGRTYTTMPTEYPV